MKTTKSMSVFCRSLGGSESECRFSFRSVVFVLSFICLVTASCTNPEIEKKLEAVTNRLGVLEDTQEIRNLHHAYGYYIDKCLYEDVVDLFADDGEVHFAGGVFKGKEEGVRRLYVGSFLQGFTGGKPGPVYGFLLDHLQMQDVIHVAPDRKTAKARFRCFMQAGAHETAPSAIEAREKGETPLRWWEGGIYENTYVKEDGVWKIKVLYYNPLWHASYETGWGHTRMDFVPTDPPVLYPENPTGPDALMDPQPVLWPKTMIVPFHYNNPVTGKPLTMESDWNKKQ